ncbi:sensor histidine kinase [Dyadobacter sp. 32]|uniref:sensor histidine kinase n=1 Tax=Dyadobacter sp. 32 TaxID=538966 RepID=UPI0039C71FBA
MIKLALLADESKYHGWVRVGYHALLILGILLLMVSAYIPWFLYPAVPLDYSFATYAGPILRDWLCVVLQYYILVFLFSRYARRPSYLIPGLAVYYFVLFTCYYYSSYVVRHYFGLPDDYTGSINHFENMPYWKALFHPATFYHLMFIIERAFYPLAVKLLIEVYRRQLRNAKLEQQFTRLELDFLKSQINPHFLFNVLNSIYALTEEESPRAARIVQQLSGMMRYSLYDTTEAVVPLAKELAFIRNYVELEQLRTAKRLTLVTRFPDSADESLLIAPFVLITFVENAFKHGVQSTTKKSWVELVILVEGNALTLSVKNTKPVKPELLTGGIGLDNVKRRLAVLYPGHQLNIINTEMQFSVELKLILSGSDLVKMDNVGLLSNDF